MDSTLKSSKFARLLASYPRSRPPLSEKHQQIYVAHYLDNREGSGPITRVKNYMESWMHRRVAAHQHGRDVLEIGAGTLNQLQYEPDGLVYDAIEPFKALWEGRPEVQKLRKMYGSLEEISSDAEYDRVISVAVLEHLTDLPRVVAAAALRMRPDGCFLAGIPSEGGLLWGLSWRLTTGIAFRLRTGLPYADMMRHEHVNDAAEIIEVCRWLFEEVKIERFPLPVNHLSFYLVLNARRPNLERCHEVLASGTSL